MLRLTQIKTKIKKGDTVFVNSGKEKNKTGKVLKVIESGRRVIIEKLNIYKKHLKPTQTNPAGGIVDRERPVMISNVQLFCSKCNAGVRVGVKSDKKEKTRFCKKCGQTI